MSRLAARWGPLAAACSVGFVLVVLGVRVALDRAGVEALQVPLDVALLLTDRLEEMAEQEPQGRRVMFLGDSLVMELRSPETSVAARLRQRLASRGRPVEVRQIAGSGTGVFSHYFLSEQLAEVRADVAVLSFNLRWLSPAWDEFEREVLAGWLPARRWPELLRVPAHAVGASAGGVLFDRLLVTTGVVRAWRWLRRQQVRVARSRWSGAQWLQARSGVPKGLHYRETLRSRGFARSFRNGRSTGLEARRTLGAALGGVAPELPRLRVLDGWLRRTRASGADCLVYVAPLNVEHLQRIGVYDRAGIARTLATLAALVSRHGGTFVDLHDRLPDSAFLDASDHLSPDAEPDARDRVARRLAPPVRRSLRPRTRS